MNKHTLIFKKDGCFDKNDNPASLGSVIKSLRKQAGLTQEELGKKCGMQSQNISRLERSTRGNNCSVSTLMRIANALGYRMDISLL